MNKVKEIVKAIDRLPPFPHVALKVMEMAQDEEVSFRELAKVIELDQSMTANLLKVCNSPFFGLRRKVSSVREALVYLGQRYFTEVIWEMASAGYFREGQRGYDLERGELWRHAVACALGVQLLERRLRRPEDPLVFTAALLHDIGKVILSEFVADALQAIRQRVSEGASFLEAEQQVLGVDHAALGGMIAEQWAFPGEMAKVIRLHHQPEEDLDGITPLVYLADTLCLQMGIGTGLDGLQYRAKDVVLKAFGLTDHDLMEVMAELEHGLEEAETLVSLS